MSKVCTLTGKRPSTGNTRSKSLRATKRRYLPNIQKMVVVDPVTGLKKRVKVSTRARRTLAKNPTKFSKQIAKLTKKQR